MNEVLERTAIMAVVTVGMPLTTPATPIARLAMETKTSER